MTEKPENCRACRRLLTVKERARLMSRGVCLDCEYAENPDDFR